MKTRNIDIEILCICSLSIGAEALMVKENLTLNVGGKWLMKHQYTPGARKKSHYIKMLYVLCAYYARMKFGVN